MRSRAPKRWSIRWRGKITGDAGMDMEIADNVADAHIQYERRYPMREVLEVTLVKRKRSIV